MQADQAPQAGNGGACEHFPGPRRHRGRRCRRCPQARSSSRSGTPTTTPIPNAQVTLGIVHNIGREGREPDHVVRDANAEGCSRRAPRDRHPHAAYRVVGRPRTAPAFAAMPFRPSSQEGHASVTLHVYPVTHDIAGALIVTQSAMFIELKDDRIQLQQAVNVFNLGKVAWVPDDLVFALPPEYTAFSAGPQQMSDIGVDGLIKRGVKIHGTFGPGRHDVEFRWQLPYDGDKEVVFDVAMPPNCASARVFSGASAGMRLEVEGFPEAKPRTNAGRASACSSRSARCEAGRAALEEHPRRAPQPADRGPRPHRRELDRVGHRARRARLRVHRRPLQERPEAPRQRRAGAPPDGARGAGTGPRGRRRRPEDLRARSPRA